MQAFLPPPRFPGYVLANHFLAFRVPHQFTEYPENFFFAILLLCASGSTLPERFHPAQAPRLGLCTRTLSLAHSAPFSDPRIEHQHNRRLLFMHHILRVSHVYEDNSIYRCSYRCSLDKVGLANAKPFGTLELTPPYRSRVRTRQTAKPTNDGRRGYGS